jgi:hypothetical protein
MKRRGLTRKAPLTQASVRGSLLIPQIIYCIEQLEFVQSDLVVVVRTEMVKGGGKEEGRSPTMESAILGPARVDMPQENARSSCNTATRGTHTVGPRRLGGDRLI